MKKENQKNTESQLLELLKKVLPKATHDAQLAGKIYQAIEHELQSKARAGAFNKFCNRVELPDLEPKSLEVLQTQLAQSFKDADITLQPNRKEKLVTIELALPDGTQFSGEVRAGEKPAGEISDEQEITLKFVPFPVCMPGDKELVWMLAKHEDMAPDEAGIALSKAQEDFWASKTGQKLMRDRVECTFPEFIARVPSGSLKDAGLKRHYKTPEAIKILRNGKRG